MRDAPITDSVPISKRIPFPHSLCSHKTGIHPGPIRMQACQQPQGPIQVGTTIQALGISFSFLKSKLKSHFCSDSQNPLYIHPFVVSIEI